MVDWGAVVRTGLILAFVAFGVGVWAVAFARSVGRRKEFKSTVQVRCSVCSRPLVFDRNALEPLSPAEKALVVREKPWVLGRRLAEFICPYCEAAHCFTVDRPRVEWVGVNFSQPQTRSANCFECRRRLRRPPGVEGQTIQSVPNPAPDIGLVCPHCHAVCCVECCEKAARNRTKDGSLLCPRCFRGPLERLFYP